MQVLAFFAVYLVGGVGIAAYALLRCARRHPLDLAVLTLLWPLCGPFLFGSPQPAGASRPRRDEGVALATRCQELRGRLVEIDLLLGHKDWNPRRLRERHRNIGAGNQVHKAAQESLAVRLEHIERLTFLRKVHADELDEAQSLLDRLKSQEQLSRFLPQRGQCPSDLEDIRARIADAESVLASEAELIALCHESL